MSESSLVQGLLGFNDSRGSTNFSWRFLDEEIKKWTSQLSWSRWWTLGYLTLQSKVQDLRMEVHLSQCISLTYAGLRAFVLRPHISCAMKFLTDNVFNTKFLLLRQRHTTHSRFCTSCRIQITEVNEALWGCNVEKSLVWEASLVSSIMVAKRTGPHFTFYLLLHCSYAGQSTSNIILNALGKHGRTFVPSLIRLSADSLLILLLLSYFLYVHLVSTALPSHQLTQFQKITGISLYFPLQKPHRFMSVPDRFCIHEDLRF